jgi:hypothetical protein
MISIPESENQFIVKEEHKYLSLSLEIYQSAPVYDEYDDDNEFLDQESPFVKHLDQQFHENNKPIVHEGSDHVYDSYSSELEPSFEDHISTSTYITSFNSEPVNDIYELDSLEGCEGDVEELQDQLTISYFPQHVDQWFPGFNEPKFDMHKQENEVFTFHQIISSCDPVAIYMESKWNYGFYVFSFIRKESHNCKYGLQDNFWYFYLFLSFCAQRWKQASSVSLIGYIGNVISHE